MKTKKQLCTLLAAMACTMSIWGQTALAAAMPDTYTENGVTYTYRESYGNNIVWYYNENMDRSAAVWYTDDTYSKVRDSITYTGRGLPSRTKDIPTVTEDLGYDPDSYPYGFEDICFGKDISLTFSPLQTGPSTGTTPLVGVDSSKGKIEAGNTHVVNGDTVYNALDTEQTARENADTALSGRIDTIDKKVDSKADANLGNLTDAGKQVIRNTMKPDLAKKADADASNIDVNAFSGKLGVGTITDGDMASRHGQHGFQSHQRYACRRYSRQARRGQTHNRQGWYGHDGRCFR